MEGGGWRVPKDELVLKAQRLLYRSTPGTRVIKKKKKVPENEPGFRDRESDDLREREGQPKPPERHSVSCHR